MTRRIQPRSTSAMCLTRPSSESVDGAADRSVSWAGASPAHLKASVSRCQSSQPASIARSSAIVGGLVRRSESTVGQPKLMSVTTVLLAEDDAAIAEPLSRALQREGYDVDVAADGTSALERVRIGDVDLLVLDLGLPGMDGLEVCRRGGG